MYAAAVVGGFPSGLGPRTVRPLLLSKSMPFLFCGESRAFPESLASAKGGERGRDPSWESICRAEEEEGAEECTLRTYVVNSQKLQPEIE